jgi:CO/xanthine dehydrogenase Mo-binding subunit
MGSETSKFKSIRKSIEKVDARGFVLGKPLFTEDFYPREALTVKLVHSPYAHAVIKNIDTSEALKIPGISAILTYKDVPRIPYTRAGQGFPEPSPYDTVLLDQKMRFVGDVAGIVVAKDELTAKNAIKALKIEYDVLEPVLDFEKSMSEGTPVIHDEEDSKGICDQRKNLAAHYEMVLGAIEKEIAESPIQVESSYYYPKSQQVPLENICTYAYLDPRGRLTLVSSTQVPYHARRILSKILQMEPGKIRVIKPRIGSGFGSKQGIHAEGYAALACLKTGKPVRLSYSREESFINSYTRHDMRVTVKIGAQKDGMINAIDMYALSNTGAYGDHSLTVAMVCGSKTLPLYNKVKAVRFVTDIVYTNLPQAGAYRGYGAPQGLLALDGAIDELAVRLNLDPLEVKAKNTIREGETSPIFQIMGEGKEGVPQIAKSCKLDDCIAVGRKKFEWDRKYSEMGWAKRDGNTVRGVGCALAMQGTGIAKVDMASATLKMNDDGTFNLLVGATDLGTGSDTILSQIAAEELQVPVSRIIVYSSDTDITPFDKGAYASSTTYVSGNAVVEAAKKIKATLIDVASKLFETDKTALEIKDGAVLNTLNGKSLSYAEICSQCFYGSNHQQICETGSYVGEESPIPFMATFMEIEVDLKTGKITPVEIMSVVDCGTLINPVLAKGQVEGATLQALGTGLFEELQFSATGVPLNNSLFRYKILDRNSYGKITVLFAESYEPTGPFGAKSVSEIGIDTPTVALLNAVYHATGIRFHRIPLKPETVYFALQNKS